MTDLSPATMLGLIILLPLAVAALIRIFHSWALFRKLLILGGGAALFAMLLSLAPGVISGDRPELFMVEAFPGLPLTLKLEPLGLLFGLIASFLWIVTSIYSFGYMRGEKNDNRGRFYMYFALAIAFTMGVALSGNLLTLFVFYELLTLSTYPLVTYNGTDKARAAGRTYLGILLTTSIGFFLLAIIWTAHLTGTLDFRPGGIFPDNMARADLNILLLLFFFGVGKAALMPFHRWLPAAMVAPTPVSALLHAVAVVKAGVFTLVKIALYIFGTDLLVTLEAREFLLYLAGASILLASLVAMTKDNLKERLAYSTISQLGYITLGALLANEMGMTGAGLHILMHAFGKITLFFCAGAVIISARVTQVSQVNGLGKAMPVTMAAFFIGTLSIMGVPPAGGTWSKWYLALGTLEADELILMAVLMVSTLLNIAYLLAIPVRAFFAAPIPGAAQNDREAPWPCLLAITITTAITLALFFMPGELYGLITAAYKGQ